MTARAWYAITLLSVSLTLLLVVALNGGATRRADAAEEALRRCGCAEVAR